MPHHAHTLLNLAVASLAFCTLSTPLFADQVVYVSNTSQLGTVNLSTGAYQPIGPAFPDASQGLGYAPNGKLLTMGFSGYLNAVNPATGVMTPVGPSGLSACPPNPCTPTAVNTLASFNGHIYATDLANELYSVNQVTGLATAIGLTGMPAVTFTPLSMNMNGTLNVYDEALFAVGGKLYATFDTGIVDPSNGNATDVIPGALYQIDPATAKATRIGSTPFGLGAAVDVNGVTYAFLDATGEIAKLDLATGGTTVIGSFDPNAGIISAAVPTPEPASALIAGLGLGLFGLLCAARYRR